MIRLGAVTFVAIAVLSYSSSAQNQPPASNPQAITYAAQSIVALTGGAAINDVTLTGSVTWNGVQTDTGTANSEGPWNQPHRDSRCTDRSISREMGCPEQRFWQFCLA